LGGVRQSLSEEVAFGEKQAALPSSAQNLPVRRISCARAMCAGVGEGHWEKETTWHILEIIRKQIPLEN
jgi:hypothetical protein